MVAIRRYRGVVWRNALFWLLTSALSGWAMVYFWPVSLDVAFFILNLLLQMLYVAAMIIFQFAIMFIFLGRARVYWIDPRETGVTWNDYRGNPEVVENAKRIVTLLKGVKEFKEMGGEIIRGLLLCGPPGTGKSYLAQAIATEAGVPFCYASAPSFESMFLGMGQFKVMQFYRKARKMADKYGACVVFIDEIDAIGTSRTNRTGAGMGMGMGGMFGGGSGLINELLLQLDPPNVDTRWWTKLMRSLGLRRKKADRPAVLTIGATNMPESLDRALLRPGRFDRRIWVDAPNYEGRVDVLSYYLSKVKAGPDLNAARTALDTVGYSAAQLKHVVNEAVVLAHQRGAPAVEYTDFRAALETYEFGISQPHGSMAGDEKRAIAYHEAGHAVAYFLLYPHHRLWKVTIVRHGSALGFAAVKPTEERQLRNDSEILADIQVSLAARAAEEEFLGQKYNGVAGDLEQATQAAGLYLGYTGMGDELFSWRAFGATGDGLKALRPKINDLLNAQMAQVRVLIRDHAEFVHAIANALLERHDLTGDEIEQIYRAIYGQERPAPPVLRHQIMDVSAAQTAPSRMAEPETSHEETT